MFDDARDIAIAPTASPFAAAYERLVGDLERALWYDDAGQVDSAYQEYTDACAQALSDPFVSERVARALRRLTEALDQALAGRDARALVDDAATRYLNDVGSAWPALDGRPGEVESLVAVATGMTTLAWLFGLGASGFVSPFAAHDLFGAPASSFGGSPHATLDFTAAATSNGDRADAAADPPPDDDDGIVWQEFAVGDDGEIVQRRATTTSAGERPAAPPRAEPREHTTGAPDGPARDRTDTTGDPVTRIDRAYAAYAEALRAAGISLTSSHGSPAGTAASVSSDLEHRTADLAGAYLRLASGTGSIPDLYHHYARFLATSTELIEQQLLVVRNYERLIATALRERRPGGIRRDAEQHYRQFLATVRDAWSELDPDELTPERLAALSELTARAATLHAEAKRVAPD